MPRDIPSSLVLQGLPALLGDVYTEALSYSFPDVTPPLFPCGNRILVQLRTPGSFKVMPNGQKLFFTDESQDSEKFRTNTALVRALGPVAFKNRSTLVSWAEGDWCTPGMFVRVPMYGGDRMVIPNATKVWDESRDAIFLIINDLDVIGIITASDPASVKSLI